MNAKLNSPYIENYAEKFTKKICDSSYAQKKYITGQDILQLTPSAQVNFFVIKALFEAWQRELEALKSNPYFDYRDKNVHEALKEFMNVLSRTIKVERQHFEPLLTEAVAYSILLAVDPVTYFSQELDKVPEDQLPNFLKENKKYFKWHTSLVTGLVDRAGLGYSVKAYKSAVANSYEQQKSSLKPVKELLSSFDSVLPIDYGKLWMDKGEGPEVIAETAAKPEEVKGFPVTKAIEEPAKNPEVLTQEKEETSPKEEEKVKVEPRSAAVGANVGGIDPLQAWARFEHEEYSIMKGTIKELSESLGINQRIMFTKELFEGNPDLLTHALKSVDKCESFVDAINLLNQRYVSELGWNKESDSVNEFLQLVFRKFDQRG
ncbi:hypothetical protein A33Q_4192 [Indibacter alkaliphilus LW1]|jgi:hypothetical protein|uniref:Uncharacterized protein n=1 Tax=Indibacter alkaliphilus (strain CCUG 57479 / KCTC 22604 / LW1) TaxID=1189612 RepID=S2CZS0_INDAL|nr:hypothetical protein [Indibacter alkaliphilus]EOZ92099.1 hypothetical protein A33Q_4192 [Indibacter alkaliphilus LW1]